MPTPPPCKSTRTAVALLQQAPSAGPSAPTSSRSCVAASRSWSEPSAVRPGRRRDVRCAAASRAVRARCASRPDHAGDASRRGRRKRAAATGRDAVGGSRPAADGHERVDRRGAGAARRSSPRPPVLRLVVPSVPHRPAVDRAQL
eukprot:1141667-Prymnesium_polylepis.2